MFDDVGMRPLLGGAWLYTAMKPFVYWMALSEDHQGNRHRLRRLAAFRFWSSTQHAAMSHSSAWAVVAKESTVTAIWSLTPLLYSFIIAHS